MASPISEPTPRSGHALIAHSGRTFLVGGRYSNDKPISLATVDIFDHALYRWQSKSTRSFSTPTELHCAAYATVSNLAYFFGGYSGQKYVNTMVALDMESLEWSFIEQRNPPAPRAFARMVAVDDHGDRLLLYGGMTKKTLTDLHIFSINDGRC